MTHYTSYRPRVANVYEPKFATSARDELRLVKQLYVARREPI